MSSVLSVPLRLRMAAMAFLLCVPLAALETILVARAPWWKLPYDKIVLWSTSVALMSVPISGWISQGHKWAYQLNAAFAGIWVLLSAWVAFRMKNPALGFFTLALLLFFVVVLGWIRREMSRSFFDPELRWYEGAPRPLPGVSCQIVLGDHREDFRVSRLDRNGVFVFQPESSTKAGASRSHEAIVAGAARAKAKAELIFKFRDREIRTHGNPIRLIQRGVGAGFQFEGLSSDARKELGDFIETLRGEGYV